MDLSMTRPTAVHVEVALPHTCLEQNRDALEEEVIRIIKERYPILSNGPVDLSSSTLLFNIGASACIADVEGELPFWRTELRVHIFRLALDGGPEKEVLDGLGGEDEISACMHWELPAAPLQGLWESLVLDCETKRSLLEYATTAMLFTDRSVSPHIISWNRVILLHGPPGTGKTSLCKSLAQKLSIRLANRFECGQLLEINAHSLFSKWFSESGKLVQRLWEHIEELADDDSCFVCILVDEVESLAAARSAALNGNEPSDAIRVVNALLTQIDNIRQRSNVLVLTTSNISRAIDLAFVDRADIKFFIGLPTTSARYSILQSCMLELMRVGIVSPSEDIPPFGEIQHLLPSTEEKCRAMKSAFLPPVPTVSECPTCRGLGKVTDEERAAGGENGQVDQTWGALPPLLQIAVLSEGLSGRALRKLPFQAHACFVRSAVSTPLDFLQGMLKMVEKELSGRADLLQNGLNV